MKSIGEIDHSSVFSSFYFGVFKNFTPSERNLVLDGILKEIFSNKKIDLELIQYLIECLVFLPFSSQIEVLHCLHKINNFIDYEGDIIYTEFSSIMEEEEDEEGNEGKLKKNDNILKSASKIIFILQMKTYLENAFCITQSKLEEYDPSSISKMKNDKTIFRPIKPSFSFDKISEFIEKDDSDSIWSLLEKLYSLHQESGSTSLISSHSKKRKREPSETKRKKTKTTKKSRKKKKKYESDEEDDEESISYDEGDDEEEEEGDESDPEYRN